MAKKQTKAVPGYSKRTANNWVGLSKEELVTLDEAVASIKKAANAKFDESIEIVFNLGIDPRHSDQMVRGVTALPKGTGKDVRVAVFAQEDKAEEAKKAGADIVGADDLVEQILKGDINFDRCIATPDMMALVGKVARVLGPKGMMPNPKLGTVTDKVGDAVKAAKAGQVEYRAEKNGVVHAGVGKASFSEADIKENIVAFSDAIRQAKPSGVKGIYIKRVALTSSMGPSVRIDINTLAA